ncbi:MAG: hypothetical protein NWQ06_07425 [Leeuwenhoekiella sp.]|nr:hypothetical protein [Leeuwenhoekiella sp.]
MIKYVLHTIFIVFINLFSIQAQVGINTDTPTALLDVDGTAIIDKKLYLENPGNSTQIRGSKLIIERTDNSIVQYDISVSKYGPINYAELVFSNTSRFGITDYNTKISTDDYILSVQGYYFVEHGTGSTSVITASGTVNNIVEGYQVYAYKNALDKKWYIKCFINNGGIFRTSANPVTTIDLHMNIIIFRKGLLAKEVPGFTVNVNKNTVGTLPKPAGF